MKNLLKVALVQQKCHESREASWQETILGIEAAAKQKAKLVLLQELHAGYYFCQAETQEAFALAEPIPGPTTALLSELAKKHDLVIVGSIFERRAPGIYHNTAVVLDRDGSLVGRYRKMHIPDDPGFYEKYYFTPGDLGFKPVQTSVGKLGILVCWDQWFPEAARIMALAGAELLLYPTAIGWFPNDPEDVRKKLVDRWMTIQRSHAIANALPVLSCNRVGFEPDLSGARDGLEFWGNSFITDAEGNIVKHAGHEKPEVLFAELDLNETENQRQLWPHFRDRRIDAYTDILRKFAD